jgi:ABC-type glycerol-3-phosphate transport system substrate-binding protein
MNRTFTKPVRILLAGFIAAAVLTGCSSNSSSSSTAASDANTGQTHRGQGSQRFLQALKDAGVSDAEAKQLAQSIRETHTDFKWVLEQLKNKKSIQTIEQEMQNGTAPKMQWQGKPNGSSTNSDSNNSK